MDEVVTQKVNRAKELLSTVNHAAMATVNEDGSPHNTPYFFLADDTLEHLYWGSHPESQHSKNVARTGQIFVVLYDAVERGGLFICADNAHVAEGGELVQALAVHNAKRTLDGRGPLSLEYYQGESRQRMYVAVAQQFWVNDVERGEDGHILRDIRRGITREDLLK
jgi:hypothetical protein